MQVLVCDAVSHVYTCIVYCSELEMLTASTISAVNSSVEGLFDTRAQFCQHLL